MKMYSAKITLILLSLRFSAGIKLETAGSSEPTEYNCNHVDLEEERFVTCVCFDGVWAFLVHEPGRAGGSARWEVDGSSDGKSKCTYVGQWIRHMYRLSLPKASNKSAILRLDNHRTVFTLNDQDWEVKVNGRRSCFQGAILNSYCRYENVQPFGSHPVRNCKGDAQVIDPAECLRFDPEIIERGEGHGATCSLMPPKEVKDTGNDDDIHFESLITRRVKRQNPPAAGSGGGAASGSGAAPAERNITAEADEEYISPEEREFYRADKDMMESITDVMLKRAAKILGLDHNRKKRLALDVPAVTLLKICSIVMQNICNAINPIALQISMEAFLQMQKNYLLLKEPYIGYAQYERILRSLEKCANNSSPFEFFQNDTVLANDSFICETQVPPVTTAWIFDKSVGKDDAGYVRHTKDIPDYAASDPNVHEPVTEMVWKMFVNTHSYCYKYFKTYYNDHHTFTVTLMPFFTNQIQDVWYANGTNYTSASNSSGSLNYTTQIIWYGNLFGNLSRLYWDVDRCYSASRTAFNDYPWYMNRPPRDLTNEWTRKKRAIDIVQAQCPSSTNVFVNGDFVGIGGVGGGGGLSRSNSRQANEIMLTEK